MQNKIHLLFYFLKKDIKAKYAGSGLGLFWTILIPVVQITLFWFVFSLVMKARPYAQTEIPYIYFLLSSFFFWLAFSEGTLRAAYIIIENSEIVKKISFPKIFLPITVITSSYLLNSIGFLLFMIVYSFISAPDAVLFFLIPVVFFQFLFSLGIGMLLSALVPYIRDLGQILGYVMQGMFFLSPIIYSIEAVPEQIRIIFYLNPMTYFASTYQSIILLKEPPPAHLFTVLVVFSLLTFFIGLHLFRKLKDGFADVL